MMPAFDLTAFDPEFAGPGDWAAMYRAHKLQIVPAKYPHEVKPGETWKRPTVKWRNDDIQEKLMPDFTFERWYGAQGDFSRRSQMGIVAGRASGNIFVIDLDDYKHQAARYWWANLIDTHNGGRDVETWQQVTGGGGRQLFFRAPSGWHAPTNRTPIGVDIRGQGGFAVLPPSVHDSGKEYHWAAECEPWSLPDGPADAPAWLLEAVEQLIGAHGGDKGGERVERTASPAEDFDAFGSRVDGREDYMTRVVWGAVVDWYRECPITLPRAEVEAKRAEVYEIYERGVKSRLPGSTTEALEAEGRGPTAFAEKWRRAMALWDTKVWEASKVAPPKKAESDQAVVARAEQTPPAPPAATDQPMFVGDISGDPKPREWLVDQWIPKGVVSALYGDGGVGKTLLAQQLLYAAGVGGQWLGLNVPPTRGLGVFCEDDADELHRRHNDIKASLGHAIGNPFTDTWIWPRVGHDNLLVTFDRDNKPTLSPFFQAVLSHVLAERIELLILDTVADLFGGNEIIRTQVNFFIKSTCGAYIRQAKDAGFTLTVLILAHPSQAGRNSGTGESGSTGWNNAVRSRMYLTRPDDGAGDMRILTRMKSNYAASGNDTATELIWANGVLIPPASAAANPAMGEAVQDAARAKVLRLVHAAWECGVPYKARKDSDFFLERKMPIDLGDEYPREAVLAAIRDLQRNEKITVTRSGDKRGYRVLGAK